MILSFLLAILLSAVVPVSQPPRYDIVPTPSSLVPAEGVFTIGKTTGLKVDDPAFSEIAEDFAATVKASTGFSLTGSGPAIALRKADGFDKEAYRLTVKPSGVLVEASDVSGAFYGLQTLLQLLPAEIFSDTPVKKVKWEAPCCTVDDKPEFPYRGFLFDCGRYFFEKEEVMKFIDLMAMHKQNMFHWHLTEDQGWRIQIDKYPRLTEIGSWRKETAFHSWIGNGVPHGGYYTKDDIREVVEYARRRCVTVIPEVEIPGHSTAAIAAYPELSCFPERTYEVETRWGIWKNLYAPTATTFQFLEDVFMELFELFPSPLYHIGGDEAPKDVYRESKYCQDLMKVLGLKNVEELQTFFVKRIGDFLKAHGKTCIGWDEILDGGALEDPIAMSYRGHAPAARGIRRGIRVVLTPNRWCYLDNHQDDQPDDLAQEVFMPLKKVYSYYPAVDSIPDLSAKYIIGYETCLWTEYIPDSKTAEWFAFPRNVAASEVAWTSRPNKDWENFRARMPKILKRLEMKHIGYCPVYYEVIFDYDRRLPFPKPMNLELDYPEGVVHYTLDGSEPTLQSPAYDGNPFMVGKDDVIKARAFGRDGKPLGKITEKRFFSSYDTK
ncbi:MAG: family 20 glycosylhydrolase [Bacteroidales bacterium]|nr:family 20 glycosylhydrolase [Bacteroidales bacterium]